MCLLSGRVDEGPYLLKHDFVNLDGLPKKVTIQHSPNLLSIKTFLGNFNSSIYNSVIMILLTKGLSHGQWKNTPKTASAYNSLLRLHSMPIKRNLHCSI